MEKKQCDTQSTDCNESAVKKAAGSVKNANSVSNNTSIKSKGQGKR